MYKPTLCIDVSKSSSFACAFLAPNTPYSKPFSFSHTQDGLASTASILNTLQSKSNTKADIVLEATGNYSKPIVQYFQSQGYDVFVLNPLQTSNQKRKSMRKVKTDPIDTHRIAQVFYMNNFAPQLQLEEQYEELKNLCRQWDGINSLCTEAQNRYRSVIDLVFPNLDKVFSDICCITALELISQYSSPKAVLTADKDTIASLLKVSKHSLEWCDAKADQILQAALESLPYDKAQQSNNQVLSGYITILKTYQKVLADIRAQIIERAGSLSEFSLLRSIPGVGEITASTILGEISDINRFDSSKKLTAYSGLDPSVYQSGNYKAKNNKISKRGSHYLRKALYQATIAGITKRTTGVINQTLYQYYTKKLQEGKAQKSAIVATSSKLLRIIYGVLSKGEAFIVS